MKIFILTPDHSHLDNELWKKSHFHGKVTVRELDSYLARNYAALLFNTDPSNVEPHLLSPWLDEKLVSCEEFVGDLYPTDGAPGILAPSAFKDA